MKLEYIKETDVPNCHVLFQREGTQRLLYIKTGYTSCKPELDTATVQFKIGPTAQGEEAHVRIDISNGQHPKTKFTVDWVPLTVKKEAVEELIKGFCDPSTVSQDNKTLSKYWVTTTTHDPPLGNNSQYDRDRQDI